MNFPFKIKPQENFINLGDEVSGSIEVAVYNDLTIAEQLEYDESVAALGSETQPVVDLILKVSKEEQLTFEKAQKVIFGNEVELPPGKDAAAIRLKYSNALLELNTKLLPIQQSKQLIGATIMIRRAIAPLRAYVSQLKKERDSAKDKTSVIASIEEYEAQINALEKWSVADTRSCKELRQGTLRSLYEFFLKESNGGILPEIKEVAENTIAEKPTKTIEDLGKLVVDVETVPVNGAKSSGESKVIGPTIAGSTTKTSQVAPVP